MSLGQAWIDRKRALEEFQRIVGAGPLQQASQIAVGIREPGIDGQSTPEGRLGFVEPRRISAQQQPAVGNPQRAQVQVW